MTTKRHYQFIFLMIALLCITITIYLKYVQNHYNGDNTENIKNTIYIMKENINKEDIEVVNTTIIENYKIVAFRENNFMGIITFQKQKRHYEFYTIQYHRHHKNFSIFSFYYIDEYDKGHNYDILFNCNKQLAYFYRSKNNEEAKKFVIEKCPSVIFIDDGESKNGDHTKYQFYDTMNKEL